MRAAITHRALGVAVGVVTLLQPATHAATRRAPTRPGGRAVTRWGAVGHQLIGAAAAAALPAAMPAFFRAARDELAYLNADPDRWRDRAEAALDPAMDGAYVPDHYIDLERIPDGAWAARTRFDFLDSLRGAGVSATRGGLLPFRIEELTQRLREEFRLWRTADDARTRSWIEARIIDDAGILGHYVADGSNPHHTTIHYDGWVGENPRHFSTARGFHARFETLYVETHITAADLAGVVDTTPRVLLPLRSAILGYLRASHAQLETLYALDQAAPFDAATTDPADRHFVVERLAAGATELRDLWWTAWVTSAPGAGGAPTGR
jgi:hypothetical protein